MDTLQAVVGEHCTFAKELLIHRIQIAVASDADGNYGVAPIFIGNFADKDDELVAVAVPLEDEPLDTLLEGLSVAKKTLADIKAASGDKEEKEGDAQ